MSERELMILERQIRRNLKRTSRTKQRESRAGQESYSRDKNNYTESFSQSDISGSGVRNGHCGSYFPTQNIDVVRCGGRNLCGSHHYCHYRSGCSPTVAWWKTRKSSASMIVSVPVRRLKKRKKKCLKCKFLKGWVIGGKWCWLWKRFFYTRSFYFS